jgi:hypothetical protein
MKIVKIMRGKVTGGLLNFQGISLSTTVKNSISIDLNRSLEVVLVPQEDNISDTSEELMKG